MVTLRLRFGQRPAIPWVQQLGANDCGAACLAMVLSLHGRATTLREARDMVGIGRDGVDAAMLIACARRLGMRARGLRVDVSSLHLLPRGAILHWNFHHFVVLDRVGRNRVQLLDPALGRRTVSTAEVDRSFTGVALVFEPGDAFARRSEQPGPGPRPRILAILATLKAVWLRVLVVSVLVQLLALGVPLLMKIVVDRVVPRQDHDLLVLCGIGALGIVCFQGLGILTRSHLLLYLRTHIDTRLMSGFVDHLMTLPLAFFQRRSAGDLLMRLESNAHIRETLTTGMLSGVFDTTLAVLYLTVLLLVHFPLGLLVLAFGVANLLVYAVAQRRDAALMSRGLRTLAVERGYEVEMLHAVETIKAMGRETECVEHWADLFVDSVNVSLERGRLEATVFAILETLRLAAPLVVLAYGATLVLHGEIALGTMIALNVLAVGFVTPLSSLIETLLQLRLMGSYLERVEDVMQEPAEQAPGAGVVPAALRGRVALDNISFRYSPTSSDVVRDVSLVIQPGELVAIVGASGAGKSTLAKLLVGLYPPTTGSIAYDGQPLGSLNLGALRRQMAFVPQQPYLFARSIRENIIIAAPEASIDMVVRAAEMAQLHADVMAMPMSYETIIADGGSSLSGGQRQRVALARAFLQEPRILLLDEATSALDAVTERRVHEALATLSATRIIVAHRLSTVAAADKIVVMEAGRVVEVGKHEQLLKQGGVYATLVSAQLGPSAVRTPAEVSRA